MSEAGWALEPDGNDPDRQTLLFDYPTRLATAADRYVPKRVKVEFGARSDPWPAEQRPVRPIAAEVFPQAFEQPDCIVHALLPTRTFWEKAMLLHEETFRPASKPRRPRMARHYYDLHRLIEKGIARNAARDRTLIDEVARHRQVFFEQGWVDYTTLRPGALRLVPLPEQEAGWRDDYVAMQAEMFSERPPPFETVLASVRAFETEFNARAAWVTDPADCRPGRRSARGRSA